MDPISAAPQQSLPSDSAMTFQAAPDGAEAQAAPSPEMERAPVVRGLLTKSRLSAARQCQRLHDILYVQGYRSVDESAPLRFGTLMHSALESVWKREPVVFPTEADAFDMAKLRPMIAGYQARWDLDQYEVLGIEKEFRVPLINPDTGASSKTFELGGKFDLLLREKSTGRMTIGEHKSSSEDLTPGGAFWSRTRMDSQLSIYFIGAKALGYDPSAIMFDVLAKPAIRRLEVNSKRSVPETAEEFEARVVEKIAAEPDRYYARGEVVRLESDVEEAMRDVWQSAQQLRDAARLGRSPRNPDACSKWGRLCQFFPVCSGAESLDNLTLYRKTDSVHEELTKLTTQGS